MLVNEFGNTKRGNNNTYCQDNETSWINWNLLEKNHDLFEFFKYMIQFRKNHPVISRKLPNAVCGMENIHTHNIDARDVTIPRDAHTFAVSFAGYDKTKGADDLIYIAINAYWEDVTITLPDLARPAHGISASIPLVTETAVISTRKIRHRALNMNSACAQDLLPYSQDVIIKGDFLNGIKKQNSVQFRRACTDR